MERKIFYPRFHLPGVRSTAVFSHVGGGGSGNYTIICCFLGALGRTWMERAEQVGQNPSPLKWGVGILSDYLPNCATTVFPAFFFPLSFSKVVSLRERVCFHHWLTPRPWQQLGLITCLKAGSPNSIQGAHMVAESQVQEPSPAAARICISKKLDSGAGVGH